MRLYARHWIVTNVTRLRLILKFLHKEIDKILTQWNYTNPDLFLQHARDGTIEEAEPDAITLRQLLKEREDAYQYKSDWNSNE